MSSRQHTTHKLLLVGLLLAAFLVPFITIGVHAQLSSQAVIAGSGVLSPQPKTISHVVSTNHVGVISQVAGSSLLDDQTP